MDETFRVRPPAASAGDPNDSYAARAETMRVDAQRQRNEAAFREQLVKGILSWAKDQGYLAKSSKEEKEVLESINKAIRESDVNQTEYEKSLDNVLKTLRKEVEQEREEKRKETEEKEKTQSREHTEDQKQVQSRSESVRKIMQTLADHSEVQIEILQSMDTRLESVEKTMKMMSLATVGSMTPENSAEFGKYLREMLELDRDRLDMEKQDIANRQRAAKESVLENIAVSQSKRPGVMGNIANDIMGDAVIGSAIGNVTVGIIKALAGAVGAAIILLGGTLIGTKMLKFLEGDASIGEAFREAAKEVAAGTIRIVKFLFDGILQFAEDVTGVPFKNFKDFLAAAIGKLFDVLIGGLSTALGREDILKDLTEKRQQLEAKVVETEQKAAEAFAHMMELRRQWGEAANMGDKKTMERLEKEIAEFQKIKDEIDNEAVAAKWEALKANLKEFAEWLGLGWVVDKVEEGWTSFKTTVSDTFEAGYEKLRESGTAVGDKITELFTWFGDKLSGIGTTIWDSFTGIFKRVSDAIAKYTSAGFWASKIPDFILNTFGLDDLKKQKDDFISQNAPVRKRSEAEDKAWDRANAMIPRGMYDDPGKPDASATVEPMVGKLTERGTRLNHWGQQATTMRIEDTSRPVVVNGGGGGGGNQVNTTYNNRSTFAVPPSSTITRDGGIIGARAGL